jgi:hypothetical protein
MKPNRVVIEVTSAGWRITVFDGEQSIAFDKVNAGQYGSTGTVPDPWKKCRGLEDALDGMSFDLGDLRDALAVRRGKE